MLDPDQRERIRSVIRCLFEPWIRDPGRISIQDSDLGSGYGKNNPDHISESLETCFGLKFFSANPGRKKFGSGMEKIRIRERKKFGSGSATLARKTYRMGARRGDAGMLPRQNGGEQEREHGPPHPHPQPPPPLRLLLADPRIGRGWRAAFGAPN
jgi:hypothetical protein